MADPGKIPEELFFSKEHEWVRLEGTAATVGISDYAQSELGDVVYVEPPKVGAEVAKMGEMGVVESVKAASDIYSPVAGRVAEVNAKLDAQPELVNTEPYGEGWIAKLAVAGPQALEGLLDAAAYRKYIENL